MIVSIDNPSLVKNGGGDYGYFLYNFFVKNYFIGLLESI